jgi:hypoxanthine phosphoribosyltransferase
MAAEVRCVYAAEAIAARVGALARRIRERVPEALVLLGVLKAACPFAVDLARALGAPIELGFVEARSYGRETTSRGNVAVGEVETDLVRGATVVLADTVLDTGRTLAEVAERLRGAGAARVLTCVLFDKAAPRADFVGFSAPRAFLVGYGLDHAGRYRALPYVGVLEG